MPDGSVKEGVSFETSPYDIAAKISKQMADKIVVAKVKYSKRVATLDEGLLNPEAEEGIDEDDQWYFWDVTRALEGDCELFLFKFDDKEGKETFWHSSAHILGETLENEYGVHLCHGPPTDSGFFYDSYTGKKDIFTEKHYKDIDKAAQKIVSEKQTFSRLILTKEEALRLFGLNPFKVQLITNKIPEGGKVTAYKCGQLIDLCTGPHIPTTKMIKAFRVLKNSSAYWLGKAGNDSLQRIYGVTFPSKKEMDEHIHLLEEAAKRDHRTIGRDQGLFDMNPMSPGCGFMYPKGTIIYNKLMEMIKT